ncbi:unnamed protein product [Strongylus vulgaris]|uniref:Uncharacterized protein n=1 Tax=Strongylus vulgaris TaxID=40348 RepID=A0A3P7KD48_STRVU|nr:unnamed protein product [Strongylus vulgaris]
MSLANQIFPRDGLPLHRGEEATLGVELRSVAEVINRVFQAETEFAVSIIRAYGESAPMPRTRHLWRILKTTADLLEGRRALRLDPTRSHLERLVANTSCRTALQEDLRKHRDLLDYLVPLTTSLNENGTRASSRTKKLESVTKDTNTDSSEASVLSALVDQGVDPPYVRTLALVLGLLFNGGSTKRHRIAKAVYGCLQWVMKSLNWNEEKKEEPNKKQKAAWAAFGPLKEVTDELTDPKLQAHLFDSTFLPALCYVAAWPKSAATSHSEQLTERWNDVFCSTTDTFDISSSFAAKHRWPGHITRMTDHRRTPRNPEWISRSKTSSREATDQMG